MKRILILPLILLLAGCVTYYNVRLNGYLDTQYAQTKILPGASFFVIENKNAKNPIFETEIKTKAEKLLQQKGYTIDSYDKADLYLKFMQAMSSGPVITEPMPVYHPSETGIIRTVTPEGKNGTSFVTFPGYTTYIPQKLTLFTSSLNLEVIDAKYFRNNKEEKVIWIGEVFITGQNYDLREMINYLLVAAFEHFGENTGKSIAINIYKKDPRLKSIMY